MDVKISRRDPTLLSELVVGSMFVFESCLFVVTGKAMPAGYHVLLLWRGSGGAIRDTFDLSPEGETAMRASTVVDRVKSLVVEV